MENLFDLFKALFDLFEALKKNIRVKRGGSDKRWLRFSGKQLQFALVLPFHALYISAGLVCILRSTLGERILFVSLIKMKMMRSGF